MVFDRRFVADSLRYSRSGSNPQLQSDGLRPSLQDYCALLTRSFLMVLVMTSACARAKNSHSCEASSSNTFSPRCKRAAMSNVCFCERTVGAWAARYRAAAIRKCGASGASRLS